LPDESRDAHTRKGKGGKSHITDLEAADSSFVGRRAVFRAGILAVIADRTKGKERDERPSSDGPAFSFFSQDPKD